YNHAYTKKQVRNLQLFRYAGCLLASILFNKLCNSAADRLSSCDKIASRLTPLVAEAAWRGTIGVGAFSPNACAFCTSTAKPSIVGFSKPLRTGGSTPKLRHKGEIIA